MPTTQTQDEFEKTNRENNLQEQSQEETEMNKMWEVVRRMKLKEMPFDKFEDNHFIHATGYEVECRNGDIFTEYENDDFIDAKDCIYEKEEDIEEDIEDDIEEDIEDDIEDDAEEDIEEEQGEKKEKEIKTPASTANQTLAYPNVGDPKTDEMNPEDVEEYKKTSKQPATGLEFKEGQKKNSFFKRIIQFFATIYARFILGKEGYLSELNRMRAIEDAKRTATTLDLAEELNEQKKKVKEETKEETNKLKEEKESLEQQIIGKTRDVRINEYNKIQKELDNESKNTGINIKIKKMKHNDRKNNYREYGILVKTDKTEEFLKIDQYDNLLDANSKFAPIKGFIDQYKWKELNYDKYLEGKITKYVSDYKSIFERKINEKERMTLLENARKFRAFDVEFRFDMKEGALIGKSAFKDKEEIIYELSSLEPTTVEDIKDRMLLIIEDQINIRNKNISELGTTTPVIDFKGIVDNAEQKPESMEKTDKTEKEEKTNQVESMDIEEYAFFDDDTGKEIIEESVEDSPIDEMTKKQAEFEAARQEAIQRAMDVEENEIYEIHKDDYAEDEKIALDEQIKSLEDDNPFVTLGDFLSDTDFNSIPEEPFLDEYANDR